MAKGWTDFLRTNIGCYHDLSDIGIISLGHRVQAYTPTTGVDGFGHHVIGEA